ncbi:MAG: hypothetical protein JSS16_15985 [Proteobacteria bacterium]|uniref:DUF6916 family protein n=1 Tax=Rudaea sp. TaxID=2136325 RepID=UPI001DFCD6E5|nr:hypothetical protein [Pseudomonadota bacterium]
MLERLSSADFADLPDGKLITLVDGESIALDVAEIREFTPSRTRAATPFALILRERDAHRTLPQGIYEYRHPVHGPLHLFTVPIGPDADGMRYEIILN